jgi:hypothetical protein
MKVLSHLPTIPGTVFTSEHGLSALKGQSHEKVGKMRVWGVSLGPN